MWLGFYDKGQSLQDIIIIVSFVKTIESFTKGF